MFSFFKSDPIEKLKKERSKMLKRAMNVQRSGDLRTYSQIMSEVDAIDNKIEKLNNQ